MGKKSAQKDRAYITASEWKQEGGGHKGRLQGAKSDFRRLPFNCCAISFKPVEEDSSVVCTSDGTVMDIVNAVPYIQKHKRHPGSGEPLELKDLIRIKFHRNGDGEICCPVLGKVFNENTHIVALKTSGNVYCWEAVQELCLKPKNLRDLLTDEPFKKSDIIQIQDPNDLSKRNFAQFDHVRNNRVLETSIENDPLKDIKAVSEDTHRALSALGTKEATSAFQSGGGGKKAEAEMALAQAKIGGTSKPQDMRLRSEPRRRHETVTFKPGTATWNSDQPSEDEQKLSKGKQDPNANKTVPQPFSYEYIESHTTTGAASKSLTSTAMAVATKNEREKILQELKPKKKGYVRMHTNLGDLNIELHCDIVPKTCENFLALAAGNYYDGTKFHRSIPNFMIQGGDPTGTGKGGSSVWGPTFKDELDSRLVHSGRGVLSMANSGPNTNGSQFFILYKSARHLDFKHSVFGKAVGGFDVLSKMEKVQTDDNDIPRQEIEITGFTVFVNPYTDMILERKEEEEQQRVAKQKSSSVDIGANESLDSIMGIKPGKTSGVGRFIQYPAFQTGAKQGLPSTAPDDKDIEKQPQKKAKSASSTRKFSNFDAW